MDDYLPPAPADPRFTEMWQDLGQGTPTIAGFAQACSRSLATGGDKALVLSPEAKTILYAARNRGILEIKASHRAFESPARMLAVCVEVDGEHGLLFRSRESPAYTIRFLAGFRELCAAGLVMHHLYQEFSLTREGLDLAQTIAEEEVRSLLAGATSFGVYE
jgi:hypothetical protein